jgi:CDP-diacylglycerol--serine O-phosphatidyltransferase
MALSPPGSPRPGQRLRSLPINRMIPNVLTLLALAAGLSALRFALNAQWEHAVLAILAAAVLDTLDGTIARVLKGASKFGAELDSLSDFLCFGIAPSITLYLWSLSQGGRFGWWLVLLMCICAALRLARFNAIDGEGSQPTMASLDRAFFVGLPSPAGAGLALMPLVLWLQTDAPFFRHPMVVGVFVVLTSALMVSRLRSFTFKRIRIAPGWLLATMLGVGLYLACLMTNPWLTLTVSEIAYVGSIPFSDRLYRRRLRQLAAEPPAAADTPKAQP